MAGQVDQDVDAVGADAFGQGRIAHATRGDPMLHQMLVALRGRVLALQLGVGEHAHLAPVVAGQCGLQEIADRMVAKVR